MYFFLFLLKQCILLLNMEFSDDQLVKLLFTDYNSFYRTNEIKKSIVSIIIKQFKERIRIRETVMRNLRNKSLSFRIHATHCCKR